MWFAVWDRFGGKGPKSNPVRAAEGSFFSRSMNIGQVTRLLIEFLRRAQRYFAVMRYEQSLTWAAFFCLLVTGCKKEPV
ncbi:MAG: hypothetical protein KBF49_11285, partial [Flavobacteriales bacterium]|nr:hypothetical protein [Flavobacteriales bacterium]